MDSDGKAMDMQIKGTHIHDDSVDVKALRSLMGRFLWFPMESGGESGGCVLCNCMNFV